MTSFFKDGRSRTAALWLFAVAVLVFALLVVGGATRLTGSGLSITEWKPVTGAVPPLTDEAWRAAFGRYRATPQYRFLNHGMSLAQFKFIFWWEWAHRLLARLIGVAFAAPFVILLIARRLPTRLIWRCAAILGIGAAQAAVGWWMVRSGLEARVSVAPERLAVHLGLALVLFSALIWTGLEAWNGQERANGERRDGWPGAAVALTGAVFAQCLLGALVAGNQAGLVDNDWPLMNGRLIPADYAGQGLWATLAHSQGAVQFNHRLLAYLIFAGAGLAAVAAARSKVAPAGVRRLAVAAAFVTAAQAAVGVATLVSGAPLPLAIAHQAGAAVLLATTLAFAWRAQRS